MRELLSGPGADGGVGYLLKEKVGRVTDFLRALDTVAAGGVVIDPEVVKHATGASKQDSPLSRLTDREREVLMLMAEDTRTRRSLVSSVCPVPPSASTCPTSSSSSVSRPTRTTGG